jgi:HEAT repeat protein
MNDDTTDGVLSRDFDTASRALEQAITSRDPGPALAALGHPALEIRRQAADALGEFGGRAAVPRLLDALEQNQSVLRGGTETGMLQAELNVALVAAVQKLTGVEFGAGNPPSDADVRRVLEQGRRWWEANRE